MRAPDIELTSDEKALFDAIEFDGGRITRESYRQNGELVESLFSQLSARHAFPEQRLRWFTVADLNPGGRGKSRRQQWAKVTRDREILRHPNFVPIFAYFICGPDLPVGAIAAFRQAVNECGMVTSSDIPILSKLARALARRHGLDAHHAGDEFYKLALDCGFESRASFIRDGVRRLR